MIIGPKIHHNIKLPSVRKYDGHPLARMVNPVVIINGETNRYVTNEL